MLDLALNPAHQREVLLLLPFRRANTNREIGFVLARNGLSRCDDWFRSRFGDQHSGQLTLARLRCRELFLGPSFPNAVSGAYRLPDLPTKFASATLSWN